MIKSMQYFMNYTQMDTVRTVFIGTSEEGVPTLKFLLENPRCDVVAVVTQPDRPTGRKQILTPTPIKEIALQNNVQVYTPENKLENYQQMLNETKPELIVTISFGEFLPEAVIDYPKYKCLNIHYSLLPELRGAVPVQMAILKGLKKTGVSVTIMEVGCDTGPIVGQKEMSIDPFDTTITLKEKLIPLGQELFAESIDGWIDGDIEAQPQEEAPEDRCYRDDISKEKAEIHWDTMEPEYIERMARAFQPWPIAWTTLKNGKRVKIFESAVVELKHKRNPGELFSQDRKMYFATKDQQKCLNVKQLQIEGKQQMSEEEFSLGWRNN